MFLSISSTLLPSPVYVPSASTNSSPAFVLSSAVCRVPAPGCTVKTVCGGGGGAGAAGGVTCPSRRVTCEDKDHGDGGGDNGEVELVEGA